VPLYCHRAHKHQQGVPQSKQGTAVRSQAKELKQSCDLPWFVHAACTCCHPGCKRTSPGDAELLPLRHLWIDTTQPSQVEPADVKKLSRLWATKAQGFVVLSAWNLAAQLSEIVESEGVSKRERMLKVYASPTASRTAISAHDILSVAQSVCHGPCKKHITRLIIWTVGELIACCAFTV